jgi:hypothetical protein
MDVAASLSRLEQGLDAAAAQRGGGEALVALGEQVLRDGVLAAALRASPAAAAAAVTLLQRLVEALEDGSTACPPQLLKALVDALLCAVQSPDAPPSLANDCAGLVVAALARCATAAARRLRDRAEPAGADAAGAKRDGVLNGFFALSALKLAAKLPVAAAAAWSSLLSASVEARLACAPRATPDAAAEQRCALLAASLPRLNACVYRVLEAAPPDAAAALLQQLCTRTRGGPEAAARVDVLCAAVLSRADRHAAPLRAAAAAQLRWALHTAGEECVPELLAVPHVAGAAGTESAAATSEQQQPLRRTLLSALGVCMSACAAGAAAAGADSAALAAWRHVESALFDVAVAPHPLTRALALDAWAALAAAAPPALAARHATAALALARAVLTQAESAQAQQQVAAAHRRARDAAAGLGAAACRLLEAATDADAANAVYEALLMSEHTFADAIATGVAAALLHAGFPLARLRGAAAAHAACTLPAMAAEAASAAAGASLQGAAGGAQRVHGCGAAAPPATLRARPPLMLVCLRVAGRWRAFARFAKPGGIPSAHKPHRLRCLSPCALRPRLRRCMPRAPLLQCCATRG